MLGGADPTSAFSALGNETRLRIVLELGGAGDPGEFGELGFGELQSLVGVEDNGNFNYHLQRLTGEFVERTDGGYRLALPGVYIYRALKTGPLAGTPDRDRLETDVVCPSCAVPRDVWIAEGRGHLGCPDCGTVDYRYPLPAGALALTDGPALARALRGRAVHDTSAMVRGFCPYCSGPVTRDPTADPDVLPDGGEGGDVDALTLTFACEHCRWFVHTNAAGMLESHPRVSAFLSERSLDSHRRDPWGEASFALDVRSEEPWAARVHVALGDETLSLELDGDLEARELESEPPPAEGDAGGSDGGGRTRVTGRGSGV